jgi:hypothetical protein
MAKTFTTPTKTRDVIEFTLDDADYHFTPHKVASVMMPVLDADAAGTDADSDELTMTQRTWEWLKAGLPPDEYDRIWARLDDPDDDLDVPDVAEVVRWLIQKVSGRPTGRRRG